MKEYLALPLDFDRRPETRLFCRYVSGASAAAIPLLVAYQIWLEWGTCGEPWRRLRNKVEEAERHRWDLEDLTHIIESFVSWNGEAGGLIACGIKSGFFRVEERDGISGLVLSGFAKLNEHLSPDYKTIQQLGGEARAAKHRRRQLELEAAQRREVMESQGVLPFGSSEVSKEEQELCYALIIRLDRASGAGSRPGSGFTSALMEDALRIVRTHTPEEIDAVEAYVLEHRDDPTVVTVTDRVIAQFRSYLAEASR